MPIRLSDLVRDERTAILEWDGDEVKLVYRPSNYTPTLEQAVHDEIGEGLPNVAIARMLALMLVSWDVLGDDGEPVPTDFDTVRKFPAEFLQACIICVTADRSTEREDRKNSGDGSGRVGSLATARNGTR